MNNSLGERNEGAPIYLWIRQFGSINNINDSSRLRKDITGISILIEVLTRLFRIYKVPAYRSDKILYKAKVKYRAGERAAEYFAKDFTKGIGLVNVSKFGFVTSTSGLYAKQYADKQMKVRCKKVADLPLDIKRFYYEIEGVRKYEIRIR